MLSGKTAIEGGRLGEGDPVEEKAPHFHAPSAAAIAATASTPKSRIRLGVFAGPPITRPVIDS